MTEIGQSETIYYAFKPTPEVSGTQWEEVGHSYRGFRCTRESIYGHWSIAYEDGSLPPVPLRGKWTDKTIVHETIDAFLLAEWRKQQASEQPEDKA